MRSSAGETRRRGLPRVVRRGKVVYRRGEDEDDERRPTIVDEATIILPPAIVEAGRDELRRRFALPSPRDPANASGYSSAGSRSAKTATARSSRSRDTTALFQTADSQLLAPPDGLDPQPHRSVLGWYLDVR